LAVGNLVLALGRPGKSVQATQGIVSALGPAWQTPAGSQIDRYLQSDVLMYPGFSGGPLIAADCTVVGMNTSGLLQGVSAAVPSETVRKVVGSLLEHGTVPRGYLGIGVQPVRLSPGVKDALKQETGLMVMSVEENGPASAAGMAQGDVLVVLDGSPVEQIDDLQALLGAEKVGTHVVAVIVRGGAEQSIEIEVGRRE
jgi:S1-C subfamily serine protease